MKFLFASHQLGDLSIVLTNFINFYLNKKDFYKKVKLL
jgi:hypothetical protein